MDKVEKAMLEQAEAIEKGSKIKTNVEILKAKLGALKTLQSILKTQTPEKGETLSSIIPDLSSLEEQGISVIDPVLQKIENNGKMVFKTRGNNITISKGHLIKELDSIIDILHTRIERMEFVQDMVKNDEASRKRMVRESYHGAFGRKISPFNNKERELLSHRLNACESKGYAKPRLDLGEVLEAADLREQLERENPNRKYRRIRNSKVLDFAELAQ